MWWKIIIAIVVAAIVIFWIREIIKKISDLWNR